MGGLHCADDEVVTRAQPAMAGPQQISQAIEHTSDGIVIVDYQGLVRFVNPAAETIFGRSRTHLLGKPFGFPMIVGDVGEIDILRPAGPPAVAQMRVAQATWRGRRAHLVLLVDVTAHRATEEQLARERRYILQLIQLAPALICCVRADGAVRYLNPTFTQQTGYSAEEMQGQDFWQTVFRPTGPGLAQELLAQVSGEAMVQRELPIYPKVGPAQVVSWTWLKRSEGDLEELVGFGTNISSWKQMDQMKDDFISSLSHELRSPLTSLLGSLRLVEHQVVGEIPPAVGALVDIALRNTRRLIRLCEDILDLRKIDMGQIEFALSDLELVPLVEQAVEATREVAEHGQVELRLFVKSAGMRVRTDGDRLLQVITNLLVNAVKFSPPHEEVRISVEQSGGAARVTISDHGPGILDEHRPQLFERFVRTRVSPTRSKAGTGLGLSIAKSIIERLGGQIGFTTEVGVGTTFYFDLPTCAGPARDELAPPP